MPRLLLSFVAYTDMKPQGSDTPGVELVPYTRTPTGTFDGLEALSYQLAPLRDNSLSLHEKQLQMESASLEMAMREYDFMLNQNLDVCGLGPRKGGVGGLMY